jgi:DNA-binding MarR family transcriptional regulator
MDRTSEIIQECAKTLLEVSPLMKRSISSHYYRELDKSVLTPGQYQVLFLINRGNNTISNLAACIKVSVPTVSRQVDFLESHGLITRKRDSEDRRVVYLEMTEAGSKLVDETTLEVQRWMSNQLKDLDQLELIKITEALNTLREIFKPVCQK